MAVIDMSDKEVEASISLLHMMQPLEDAAGSAKGHGGSCGPADNKDAMHDSLLLVVASQASGRGMDKLPSSRVVRRNAQLSTLSRDLTLDELRAHFDKPIVEVAREFGICTTFLKKICRRCGIKRWPHRQIRSLARTIEMLQQVEALASSPQEKAKYAAQITQLEEKKRAVFENPDANGKLKRVKKYAAAKGAVASTAVASETTVQCDKSSPPPLQFNALEATSMDADSIGHCSLLADAANSFLSAPPIGAENGDPASEEPKLATSARSPPLGVQIPPLPELSTASHPFSLTTPLHVVSSSHSPLSSTVRISPSNRKLAVLVKADAESRLRSSSIGSLQDKPEEQDAAMEAA
ncbi:hypothetical protein BBJ28_00006459 [Nothophytophthora sp. Chile5]|nr:hypothetical protein BBJ28_00006459 [Nothophytophthora sp. Chile5]